MKNLIAVLCTLTFVVLGAMAQSPAKFNYQAVARDANNDLLDNTTIGIRISVLEGSSSGSEVYSEEHSPATNGFGLFNLQVGNGSNVSGDLETIDWGNESYFIQVEMDEAGGTNYSIMSASELVSVPYALFASHVANDSVLDDDGDPMNEIQTITWQNDSLILSDGGSVDLSGYDQTAGVLANQLSIDSLGDEVDSNSTYISQNSADISTHVSEDADTSAMNELNNSMTLSNDTLTLSDAGGDLMVDLAVYTDDNDWVRSNDSTIYNTDDRVGVGTSDPMADIHLFGDLVIGNTDSAHILYDSNQIQAMNGTDDGTLWLQYGGKLNIGQYFYDPSKVMVTADSGMGLVVYRDQANGWNGSFGNGIYIYDDQSSASVTNGLVAELYAPDNLARGQWNLMSYMGDDGYGMHTQMAYSVGDMIGIINDLDYASGDAYGMFNDIANSSGLGFGVYNYIVANNTSPQYGTRNYTRNNSTGPAYGAYNFGQGSGPTYGVFNYAFQSGSVTSSIMYGSYSRASNFSSSTTKTTYANYNYGQSVSGGTSYVYGSYNTTTNSATTAFTYGVYSEATGGTAYAGYFSGSVYSTVGFTTSDAKFKTNVADLGSGLSTIMELKPRTYTFKTDEYRTMGLPEGEQFGLLAQELEEVLPSLVKATHQPARILTESRAKEERLPYEVVEDAVLGEDGVIEKEAMVKVGDGIDFKAINYEGLIPVLISATQEQQALIDEQAEQLEEQRLQMIELLERIESLEN